ncbi:hypothetical protein RJ639_022402 [Escallonia herrerae]|uniref:Leucine-rich repeat-containing N-terminal plant-type domain-containing protein n=1 Tax=Escallonia herrerae TaxID=1293975 RepID=A0AA88V2V2_9ASTE|nr:hypothetical protein RJ639_022402 [Escallonia herrerae]
MNIREKLPLGNFFSMAFKRKMLLLLVQHLVLIAGQDISGYHRHHHPLHYSLQTDRAALLAFKRVISSDPISKLANWNESTDVCDFTGVRCNKYRHRVVNLSLVDTALEGLLSPFLTNLTRLRVLELPNNHLYGILPPEFSSLRHLRTLKLEGNNLHGQIPDCFYFLSDLSQLALMGNNFTGTIPPSLFSNCTSLLSVDLSQNSLIGRIPPEIGNCPILWNLNLYNNQFTGEIPVSLANVTAMYNLDVEYNHLSGELPSDTIGKLSELVYLHLSYNNMVSHDLNTDLEPFFTALTNCTSLWELEMAGMGLAGRLPNSIGRLSAKLRTMLLQENQILGSIPPGLAKLSSLLLLNLTSNLLNETISAEISQLQQLQQLFLSHNSFTGEIPAPFGHFPHLGLLDLSNNRFSGNIPESLGNLVGINSLFLNNNLLSGKIPPTLGHCRDLYRLDLSYNRLTGNIPPEISGLREIRMFLNLSHNRLEGPLPIELSKLENVQDIDLSSNNLSGHIFVQISSCIALRMINFSNNSLEGQLPESLGELRNLEALDVSNNSLSGTIPTSLSKMQSLNFLNLSYNNFAGMVPSEGMFDSITILSFLGNPHLCGVVHGIPICHKKRHYFRSRLFLSIFCIVISMSMFFSTICCVIGYRHLRVMISSSKSETERKSPPEVIPNFPRITYKELSDATGGFDEQRLVGSGGYGRVYKGVLHDGTPIAVKRGYMMFSSYYVVWSKKTDALRIRPDTSNSRKGRCFRKKQIRLCFALKAYEFSLHGTFV